MISAGPSPSSDGSMPRSTRNGAPMRSAMSSGVTKRRFSQLVPSRVIRSPIVRPTEWVGTNTHFARVGCAVQSRRAGRQMDPRHLPTDLLGRNNCVADDEPNQPL